MNMKLQQVNFKLDKSGNLRHFRLLGLKRGECRIPIIRAAAEAMAISLSDADASRTSRVPMSRTDIRRAEVAIAAYKLLDPRGRTDLYERVQLSYPVDLEGSEIPVLASNALVDKMPAISEQDFGKSRPNSGSNTVGLMTNQMMEDVVGLPVIADSSNVSLDERRELVRLIREDKPEAERRPTALGWLWSRMK